MGSLFNKQEFANRIRELRKARGLSQKTLAESAGVPLYMIRVFENEKLYRGLDNFVKLAKFFNTSTDWLLTGKEN